MKGARVAGLAALDLRHPAHPESELHPVVDNRGLDGFTMGPAQTALEQERSDPLPTKDLIL